MEIYEYKKDFVACYTGLKKKLRVNLVVVSANRMQKTGNQNSLNRTMIFFLK